MDELGGLEFGAPGEGASATPEELSEEAKQRFAGASAALKQIAQEEKKAKRRDQGIAQTILQFLTDTQRTHLAAIISSLVARDCPSIFLLSILSLMSPDCRKAVEQYLSEQGTDQAADDDDTMSMVPTTSQLDASANRALAVWVVRMQRVLSLEAETTLKALLIGEGQLDGSVLQLTTFVLQEFLREHHRNATYENLQPLAAGILQNTFAQYLTEQFPLPRGEG